MKAILTLNAGSSSIKFSVWQQAEGSLKQLASGLVDALGDAARLVLAHGDDRSDVTLGKADHSQGVSALLSALEPILRGRPVAGVGHRVVHGGPDNAAPAPLTPELLDGLRDLTRLAPLHQPHNLAGIEAAISAFPNALQVACFDTAFHRGQPFEAETFALPRKFYDEGVRRYGFHGLSYDYIAGVLKAEYPALAGGRTIVAHLGNGASLCGMLRGRSIGSSMGFTALDGLPMGTRCGQIDPGVLLYLMGQGYDEAQLTQLLYHQSGLLGLSGLSHDMRTLLASDAPEATQALSYYTARIRREIGAMAAQLGGLDGLVFCGGVGENAASIRAGIVSGMEWLGLLLDTEANASGATVLQAGTVPILKIPTDEECVIARATAAALP